MMIVTHSGIVTPSWYARHIISTIMMCLQLHHHNPSNPRSSRGVIQGTVAHAVSKAIVMN
eukprot:1183376-Prorocentrum_minimum.AAC.5